MNRPTIQQNDREGGDKVRTREQIETHLASLLAQINECNRIIKAADEAHRRRDELRQELARVAAEYAETADKVEIHIIR